MSININLNINQSSIYAYIDRTIVILTNSFEAQSYPRFQSGTDLFHVLTLMSTTL